MSELLSDALPKLHLTRLLVNTLAHQASVLVYPYEGSVSNLSPQALHAQRKPGLSQANLPPWEGATVL